MYSCPSSTPFIRSFSVNWYQLPVYDNLCLCSVGAGSVVGLDGNVLARITSVLTFVSAFILFINLFIFAHQVTVHI